jgi:hypothetical protein
MLIRMRIVTGGDVRGVLVEEGGKEASLVGSYWNAVKRFLAGDADALQPFEGKTVGPWPLETDPDTIESLATIGEIDVRALEP